MSKVNNKIKSEIVKMSFESSMERLEEIVEKLSSDKIDLESMLQLYEEGSMIRHHCLKRLEDAKLKIEVISESLVKGEE